MGLSAPPQKHAGPRLVLYGPLGLRAHLRTTLATCYASLAGQYVVHELLWPTQPEYPHEIPSDASPVFHYWEGDQALPENVRGQERILPWMPPHQNEVPGTSIRMDPTTYTWQDFATITSAGIQLSAAPISHRCPTIGYVFQEPATASTTISARDLAQLDSNTEALFESKGIRNPRILLKDLLRERIPLHLPDGTILTPPPLDRPGRKLCILGDTCDASSGLVQFNDHHQASSPLRGMYLVGRDADLLVHECTYASMRQKDRDRAALVSEDLASLLTDRLLDEHEAEFRAVSRGHSTPCIAGTFAGRLGARNLVLNHFSVRFAAPETATYAPLKTPDQLALCDSNEENLRRFYVMREFGRQAKEFWHTAFQMSKQTPPPDTDATAAYDGLCIDVGAHPPSSSS
ncbi:ribonuclease Z [Malassezia yamatoensis]|uniref:Ribonuclease Z n=1 Tax=Malassezia yamatoensis TaxID=253288 RepID=A0AAJ5YVD4_9BASI|nr:ribonuclease Z [Malassezia yamatoensis]